MSLLFLVFAVTLSPFVFCFQPNSRVHISRHPTFNSYPSLTCRSRLKTTNIAATVRKKKKNENDAQSSVKTKSEGDVDEYRNVPTAFLSKFMQKGTSSTATVDPLSEIDFDMPKITTLPKNNDKQLLSTLASILDYELSNTEWFVTGLVNPAYFSPEFTFIDPDVKLSGIEEYARGVRTIFDQQTSRAQIVSCVVNTTLSNTITVTWRLSGRVNIGPVGLPIKPYICYTDFTIDTNNSGLIIKQEDRFDIPGWDIVLSALFPFSIGWVTKAPAPEVKQRIVRMPPGIETKNQNVLDDILKQLGFGLAELFNGV